MLPDRFLPDGFTCTSFHGRVSNGGTAFSPELGNIRPRCRYWFLVFPPSSVRTDNGGQVRFWVRSRWTPGRRRLSRISFCLHSLFFLQQHSSSFVCCFSVMPTSRAPHSAPVHPPSHDHTAAHSLASAGRVCTATRSWGRWLGLGGGGGRGKRASGRGDELWE